MTRKAPFKGCFGLLVMIVGLGALQGGDLADKGFIKLFNGRNLDGFDIVLADREMNSDPRQVFRVNDGVIHVSGEEWGYILTKQEYENYHLRAEFKWGQATHAPRKDKPRDSGILFHVVPPLQRLAQIHRVSDHRGPVGRDHSRRRRFFPDGQWRDENQRGGEFESLRALRPGSLGAGTRIPGSGRGGRETPRRVESAGGHCRWRPREAFRQRQARKRGNGSEALAGAHPVSVRGGRVLFPKHRARGPGGRSLAAS